MVLKTPKGKGESSAATRPDDPLKDCPFGVVQDKTTTGGERAAASQARCAKVEDFKDDVNDTAVTQLLPVSPSSSLALAAASSFDDPERIHAERRAVAKSKNGAFLEYHFIRPVRGRKVCVACLVQCCTPHPTIVPSPQQLPPPQLL
jgi:hypothetical protein